jgi:DHA1 family bicyclomycin/chloramphenicol resistance-like MFS transporter
MKPVTKRLPQAEFIALMAMLAATIAFSIDAMLPALPEIAAELSPNNLNRAQLILTSFVLGMGIGTFFTGPLSDAFGRKPVMVGGAVLYILATTMAWASTTMEMMLISRILMGVGAAGPRVVAMAMVRDIYGGRDMARIMSFVMMVFALVPALAPTMGHYIIIGFGWRAIFVAFIVFSLATAIWLMLRQPETLAVSDRRPLDFKSLVAGTKEVFSIRTTRLSIMIQTLTFGSLFASLSSTQQLFDVTYGQGDVFHLWFGGIAIIATSASILNAKYVGRLGMRAIIRMTFIGQIALTSLLILITLAGGPYWLTFGMFVVWTIGVFTQAGLAIGNLNALAMEPVGHIAGIAASIIAALSTVGAVIIAAPIGLAFNGTPLPMAIGTLACVTLGLWLTTKIKRPGED